MRLGTIIVSLLFATSLTLVFFVLSGKAEKVRDRDRGQGQPQPPRRRNPIRDRYIIVKPGACPQNYYTNGTKTNSKHFRYHEGTKQCYPIDEKGPCGKNMIFYRVGNSEYGHCDCDHKKRCGRPLLYWKEADACFHVNTQGPCQDGYWLTYGLSQKPVCQKNFCLHQEKDSPSYHRARKFWVMVNGQCIKTRTRGYCPDPEQVMFFREGEAYPQCVSPKEATVCSQYSRISRPCWAGQKFDTVEKCRDKVGLWGSEDDH